MINSTSSVLNISYLTDPSLTSVISFTTGALSISLTITESHHSSLSTFLSFMSTILTSFGNCYTLTPVSSTNRYGIKAGNVCHLFYTDTDNTNVFIVSSGVYIVKYIFKSWNNQQLKLSYKRPTFTL